MNKKSEKLTRSVLLPVMDIMIALVIITGIAAGVIAAVSNHSAGGNNDYMLTAVFGDVSLSPGFAVGDSVYFPDGSVLGVIRSVSAVKSSESYFDSRAEEGVFKRRETGNTDYTVTVEISAAAFAGRLYINGNPLSVGGSVLLHTPSFCSEARVTALTAAEGGAR